MAHISSSQLPCDADGYCMVCKTKPSQQDTLLCNTCTTPWHLTCLSSSSSSPTLTLLSHLQWDCPDCCCSSISISKDVDPVAANLSGHFLITAVRAIEADESLTEQERAKKRQQLMINDIIIEDEELNNQKKISNNNDMIIDEDNDVLRLLDDNFNCSFCMKLPERPVTTPCGHNFCLKCFQKWIGQGKRSCAKCRMSIPTKMACRPRINSSLVVAIGMAKMSKSIPPVPQQKVHQFVCNPPQPDKTFTTKRFKQTRKTTAHRGKIFVTVLPDHFGPVLAGSDPKRKLGVLVGECWEDRMECRQWGAHRPLLSGIAGSSEHGVQSVALSGGDKDEEDHGDWFLYTGSGGTYVSGNIRTHKKQSFDQKFEKMNQALRVSCKKGYPVRVVREEFMQNITYEVGKGDKVRFWEDIWIGEKALWRDFEDLYAMSDRKNHPVKDFIVMDNGITSWDIGLKQVFNDWEIDKLATFLVRLGPPVLLNHQEDKQVWAHDAKGPSTTTSCPSNEKIYSYAPKKGVRYDGIYRIEKCWRKVGVQGYKVCRYLFVRCDNEPAPWASDEHRNCPRPLPIIKELEAATDVTERKESPSWDYDEDDGLWKWRKPPSLTKRSVGMGNLKYRKRTKKAKRQAHNLSVREQLLKEFTCLICREVLDHPLTTPCAHNFCKTCLENAFSGQAFVRKRTFEGWRNLRAQKHIMKCPACPNDISDFLQNPQVNRDWMGVIESLKCKTEEEYVSEKESACIDDEQSETVSEDNAKTGMQDCTKVRKDPPEQKPMLVYQRRNVKDATILSKCDVTMNTQNYAKEKKVVPVVTRGTQDV